MLDYEQACWLEGFSRVVGVDEAGRGPLAGSVVAACVLLPREIPESLAGLTDSKQLSEAKRDRYFEAIREAAIAYGIGMASPEEIDELNILNATFLAMRRAIAQVPEAEVVLVDGNRAIRELALPQKPIVKGDAKSLSIAAASVLAKVTRDRQLLELDALYPAYGFARHKGYPTKAHYAAIAEHGPTSAHRRSFLH